MNITRSLRDGERPKTNLDQSRRRAQERLGGRLPRCSRPAAPEDVPAQEGRRCLARAGAGGVAAGTHLAESTSLTVAAAADRWLKSAEARGLEVMSLKGYQQHVRIHILPRIGDVKLARLTDERIADFRDDLLRSLSRPLAAKVMTSLRSILREAGRSTTVRLKRQSGRHRERVQIPSAQEVAALLRCASQEARAIFGLAALAGLRASEIRGLAWRDVDLPGETIHVRQRADHRCVLGSPKSAEARRRSRSATTHQHPGGLAERAQRG